jgi:hypothetical protein
MDAPMAKGTLIRQVVPIIAGVITDVRFNADAMAFDYLVEYSDGDHVSSRWFSSPEIEAIEVEPAPDAPAAEVAATVEGAAP